MELATVVCMSYLARRDILYDEAFFHVTWKCHNDSWFLKPEWAKQVYYKLLLKYKDRYEVSIFSYSFMDNHPHLTGQTKEATGISSLMKTVNSQFAKKINKSKKRRGQVVMDRFKSPVIQTGESLVHVMIYGDLNAPRAGKVAHPKDYKWCSYRYYAYGEDDPLITPCPGFLELAHKLEDSQKRYREMVDFIIEEEGLKKKNYSDTLYIGDPDWVKVRYEKINKIKRAKRKDYLKRRRQFLHTKDPP